MSPELQRHARGVLCGAVLVLSWVSWPGASTEVARRGTPGERVAVGAQAAAAKKPLSYDAYDAWWSIQTPTLSRDGKWLAYALTSQGLDGQLVVRNLETGQEFRHPRGTSPAFTPDGTFVTFSIALTKAEEEKERVSGRGRGATPAPFLPRPWSARWRR